MENKDLYDMDACKKENQAPVVQPEYSGYSQYLQGRPLYPTMPYPMHPNFYGGFMYADPSQIAAPSSDIKNLSANSFFPVNSPSPPNRTKSRNSSASLHEDPEYRQKRAKNNESARKSRKLRAEREQKMVMENDRLKKQIQRLEEDLAAARIQLKMYKDSALKTRN
ncbi:unnamed protein product [Bursaphelenchus okinawaensis]|uniref:BZIP domain-containing protein n=1 Tax=Bursaphelenchus okinawaensis TaxID=465554 RepID=A0A811LFD5_9BILA|nr:unnamed protein product [Bursaphelenchus okinawaensis]CAG9121971.1 unnamed protein product [Bursaphelenchus okinawaensis]